jgi:DNA-binding HxlR family transcriptional regulator
MACCLLQPVTLETDPKIDALVDEIIGRVADKWTMIVLEIPEEHGTICFTQIAKLASGITQKMLTNTLWQMKRNELIMRTIYPFGPSGRI